MAKDVTPPTTPKQDTVSVTLPKGMTEEQFQKAFGTFNKAVLEGKARMRADGKALRHLIKAHSAEHLGYRQEEWKKEGLDYSNLKVS